MQRRGPANDQPDPVQQARRAFLEGAGIEIASSFPGITRLGGQIVASLYLADSPRSMDALATELGFSKSNIFGNLRALESAGIVERRRETGSRHDSYSLRGPYPDVVIGAYVSRLRRVTADKLAISDRALGLLGDAPGDDAEFMRQRLVDLRRKYTLFAEFFAHVLPAIEGPIDLEQMLRKVPDGVFDAVARLAKDATTWPHRPTPSDPPAPDPADGAAGARPRRGLARPALTLAAARGGAAPARADGAPRPGGRATSAPPGAPAPPPARRSPRPPPRPGQSCGYPG